MRMKLLAPLAILTLAVTLACGSSSDIKAPANQSYRFEGLTAVVTWAASRGATHIASTTTISSVIIAG